MFTPHGWQDLPQLWGGDSPGVAIKALWDEVGQEAFPVFSAHAQCMVDVQETQVWEGVVFPLNKAEMD